MTRWVRYYLANRNTLLVSVGLVLLIAGRLIAHAMLYRAGFISLTADEFSRTVLAARWVQNPSPALTGDWLPFHTYLFGTALWLKWDLVWTPRTIVIVLGIASILLMYLTTSQLLKSRRIGLISAVLLAVNPVHLWLSSTPLAEIPHTMFVLAGMLSLIMYIRNERRLYVYLAALMLALANGFRFESWLVSLLFSFFLVTKGILLYRHRELTVRRAFHLLAGASIPWIFPLVWLAHDFVETGNPLLIFESVKSYKLVWYGQARSYYNYLKAFLKIDPYALVLGPLGLLVYLLRNKRSGAARWYVMMAVIPLALFIYLHGGQVEPDANYLRYQAFFVFLTYPAIAYLIDVGVNFVARSHTARVLLLVAILGIVATTQMYTAFHFVNDPSADGLAVGQRIRTLRIEQPDLAQRNVLIELSYWQYLAIQIGANDVSHILYDRNRGAAFRDSPSLLLTDVEAFRDCLAIHDPSYIIVKSPEVRSAVERDLGLSPSEEINTYVFYQVPAGLNEGHALTGRACPIIYR